MISVVIPTLNEEKYLPNLLSDLKRQTLKWGKDFEVIVVDGGSKDRTREIARRHGCRVLRDRGRGPAEARNVGWRKAKGDVVVFIDADLRMEKDTLERALLSIRAGAVCVGFLGKVDGKLYEKAGMELFNIISLVFALFGLPNIPGYFMMLPKWVLEKTGGFDEEMAIAEDTDLSIRSLAYGPVRIITERKIQPSVRRYRKLGAGFALWQWFYSTVFLAFRKKIRSFKYEFGIFS